MAPSIAETCIARDHIHVRLSGAVTSTGALDILARIRAMANQSGFQKVLVDVSGVGGSLAFMERLNRAGAGADGIGGLDVALVLSGKLREAGSFVEALSPTKGARMRVFTDVDKALEWLRAKPAR